MNVSTSLVFVGSLSDSDRSRRYEGPWTTNPFEACMGAVLRMQPQEIPVLSGSAVLSGPPVLDIAAEGLWVVMMAVAQKYSIPASTEADIWERVAPRVNRLVQAGLVISYATAEEAAQAFQSFVLDVVHQRGLALSSIPVPAASVWRQASADFFIQLVRRVRELREYAHPRLEQLLRANDVIHPMPGGTVRYAALVDPVSYLDPLVQALTSMNPDSDAALTSYSADEETLFWRRLRLLRSELDLWRRRFGALRRLSFRLSAIPQEAFVDHVTIADVWIRTQLLLAAIDAPAQDEYIDDSAYSRAHARVRSMACEQAVCLFRYRMEQRGVTLDEGAWQTLQPFLSAAWGWVQAFPIRLDAETTQAVFIRIHFDRLSVSPAEAVQYLRSPAATTVADTQVLAAQMAKMLDWKSLSCHGEDNQVLTLLREELLTPDQLAAHIREFSTSDRPAVAHMLVDHGFLNGKSAHRLIRAGALKFTPEMFRLYGRSFPQHRLYAWLKRRILASDEDWMQDMRSFYTCVNRLTKKARQRLLADPAIRMPFVHFIQASVDIIPSGFQPGTKPLLDHDRAPEHVQRYVLASAIGPDLWGRYVLSCQLLYRLQAFQDALAGPARAIPRKDRLHTWEDMLNTPASSSSGQIHLPAALFLPRPEVFNLLLALSEDEIFRWLHEVDPNLEALLVDFRRLRKAYERRVKLSVTSNKKTVSAPGIRRK